jgi:hypothetical protein
MDEPLLDLGEIGSRPAPGEHHERRRRWRRLAEPALLAVAAVAVIVVAQQAGGRTDPGSPAPPGLGANPPASDTPTRPDLIAPAVARPGDTITVVAHRRREACGATVITFDGTRVRQRTVRYSEAPDPGWVTMVVAFDVPTTTAAGEHEIGLVGPAADCAGRARLATKAITLAPR